MIRIALSMLGGDRIKYAGIIFGVAVTTFLTALVGSMFAGMVSRTFALITDNAQADIWVMDPASETVTQTINMPDTAADRVRSVVGVESVARLAIGSAAVRLPHGKFVLADVVGVDDATLQGVPHSLSAETIAKFRRGDALLIDHAGTKNQLQVPERRELWWKSDEPNPAVRTMRTDDELQINSISARVAGEVAGTPRFTPQPVIYMTYANASRMLPTQRHRLTYILVNVEPGQDTISVAQRIEAATGLRARSTDEFKRDTVLWFIRNSGVIAQVGVIVVFAAAVGCVITGLMLFIFTKENSRLYATLKAIGARNATLLGMILSQAGVAAIVGFGLGLGTCAAIGTLLAGTGFPFRLMWYTPCAAAMLVGVVSIAATLLSARTVLNVEPGLVFRS
jgi:putative ABC transport system permease protein